MSKKNKKLSEAGNKTKGENIIGRINTTDALAILKILAEEDSNIAKKIEQIAKESLSGVDIEDIASQVYSDLDSIEVEEVWDRSGNTRNGYADPADVAWEMFEEELEPFIEELKKYQDLKMYDEAKNYCMGILKGIYRFEKESKSKYKDWAIDAPGEYFEMVLDVWKKGCKKSKNIKEMEEFIKKNFSDW